MNNKPCSLLVVWCAVLDPQSSALIYRDVVYAGNVGNNFQYSPRFSPITRSGAGLYALWVCTICGAKDVITN